MPVTIELPKDASDDLVKMKASGKLTSAEYDEFLPRVEATFKDHTKIRFLLILEDFHGWEAGALWKDFKFDIHHLRDVKRIAVVGDSKWEEWGTDICKPLTSGEMQYFDHSRREEAERWVRG